MKKLAAVLFAVWIIKYDVYNGGGYVPCAGSQGVMVSSEPVRSFQQQMCVSFTLVPKVWPITFKDKKEADAMAKFIMAQGGSTNVTVEKKN